jgi:prophage antirepressor-like protein
MNELILLDLNDFGHLRYHLDGQGDPWFCCVDVARALDYANTNMTDLFGHVPEIWKGRASIPTLGGPQVLLNVSEPGLYFFLARSDKPRALPFQMKIAEEILPTIRKTGQYTTEKVTLGVLDSRLVAKNLFRLADNKDYPYSQQLQFRAEGLSLLTKRPVDNFLPTKVDFGDENQLIDKFLEFISQKKLVSIKSIYKKFDSFVARANIDIFLKNLITQKLLKKREIKNKYNCSYTYYSVPDKDRKDNRLH